MKKVLSVMLALVMVIVGGFAFAACEKSDKITFMGLSYIPDDIPGCELSYINTYSEEKFVEYNLTASFGTPINVDNVTVYVNREKSGSQNLEKNDETGYKVTSTIPSVSAGADVPAGNYKVEYTYQDWKIKVNVIVNKLRVLVPYFQNENATYEWTGNPIVPKIEGYNFTGYNKYLKLVEGQVVAQREIGEHKVWFELRDKVNTVWDVLPAGETEYNVTENQYAWWEITYKTIVINHNDFILDTEHYGYNTNMGTETKVFSYFDEAEHPFSSAVDMSLINQYKEAGLVTIEYYKNSQPFDGTPKGEGYYIMSIKVVDEAHLAIRYNDSGNSYAEFAVFMYINSGEVVNG